MGSPEASVHRVNVHTRKPPWLTHCLSGRWRPSWGDRTVPHHWAAAWGSSPDTTTASPQAWWLLLFASQCCECYNCILYRVFRVSSRLSLNRCYNFLFCFVWKHHFAEAATNVNLVYERQIGVFEVMIIINKTAEIFMKCFQGVEKSGCRRTSSASSENKRRDWDSRPWRVHSSWKLHFSICKPWSAGVYQRTGN